MIKIISAIDEKDSRLGKYFEDSQSDILSFLEEQELLEDYHSINAECCNVAYIDSLLSKITVEPFIFIVYTHGNEKALCCNGANYVSENNSHHFKNSLFYSTACLVGKKLAPNLIEHGCKAFIGFTEESQAFEKDDYKEISINCDNAGIKALLSTKITVEQAFDMMKSYYSQQIDKFNEVKDILFAAELTANREALILLGNGSLTKDDFDIKQ